MTNCVIESVKVWRALRKLGYVPRFCVKFSPSFHLCVEVFCFRSVCLYDFVTNAKFGKSRIFNSFRALFSDGYMRLVLMTVDDVVRI